MAATSQQPSQSLLEPLPSDAGDVCVREGRGGMVVSLLTHPHLHNLLPALRLVGVTDIYLPSYRVCLEFNGTEVTHIHRNHTSDFEI